METIPKYGFPSDKESLKNKNLLTYTAMLIQTNWLQGDLDNRRYLYHNKLNKEEMKKIMGVSRRTINRNINALMKTGLIEEVNSENGVVYKFNYKKDNKYFVEIEEPILKELVHTSTNVIATYVLFKYHLKDGVKKMSQEYIAEEIGLSKSSTKIIRQITHILAKLGLIIIHKRYEMKSQEKDGKIIEVPIEVIYYELTSFEDWKLLDTVIERTKE